MSLDKFTADLIGLIKDVGQVKNKIDLLKGSAQQTSKYYFDGLQKNADAIGEALNEVFIISKQNNNARLKYVVAFFELPQTEFIHIDGKARTVFFEEAKRYTEAAAIIARDKAKKADPKKAKYISIEHIENFTR